MKRSREYGREYQRRVRRWATIQLELFGKSGIAEESVGAPTLSPAMPQAVPSRGNEGGSVSQPTESISHAKTDD